MADNCSQLSCRKKKQSTHKHKYISIYSVQESDAWRRKQVEHTTVEEWRKVQRTGLIDQRIVSREGEAFEEIMAINMEGMITVTMMMMMLMLIMDLRTRKMLKILFALTLGEGKMIEMVIGGRMLGKTVDQVTSVVWVLLVWTEEGDPGGLILHRTTPRMLLLILVGLTRLMIGGVRSRV